MTYLRSHSRPHERTRRLVIGACIVVGVIIASIQFFFPHFFPALASAVVMPFWRTELAFTDDTLRAPDAVLRENEALRLRLAEADLRLATIAAIESENVELKAFLGRHSTPTSTILTAGPAATASTTSSTDVAEATVAWSIPAGRILAAVLQRPPLSVYDQIVIDIGSADGVAVGNTVYAPGNVLVGRVVDVLGHSSKVILYSSPHESHDVLIGAGHVPATALGRGGGQYEARLPQGAAVKEGDMVIVPSLNDRPFAMVSAVLSDPTQPFETILFAPPVNIYQLRWVMVDTYARQ